MTAEERDDLIRQLRKMKKYEVVNLAEELEIPNPNYYTIVELKLTVKVRLERIEVDG